MQDGRWRKTPGPREARGCGGEHCPREPPLHLWVLTDGEGDQFNITSDSVNSLSRSFLVSKGRGLSFQKNFKMYIFIENIRYRDAWVWSLGR